MHQPEDRLREVGEDKWLECELWPLPSTKLLRTGCHGDAFLFDILCDIFYDFYYEHDCCRNTTK
jgi:hypothetical protein